MEPTKKLLLIENDPDFLKTLTEFFSEYGYEVLSATNAETASHLLAERAADLAVTDIRLRDDKDERDQSGLALAKQYGHTLPIVILTNYPTWELVRQALGPALGTIPPAVDFVFKGEGLNKLLQVVETNLAKLHPLLNANILQVLGAPPEANWRQQIRQQKPEEAARSVEAGIEKTTAALARHRELEQQNAAHWRKAVLFWSSVTMSLLLIYLVALFLGFTDASKATGLTSFFVTLYNALLIKREREANRQVQQLFKELAEVNEEEKLLVFSEIFQDPVQREIYQQKVLDQILQRRAQKRLLAAQPKASAGADEGGKSYALKFQTDAKLTLPEEE